MEKEDNFNNGILLGIIMGLVIAMLFISIINSSSIENESQVTQETINSSYLYCNENYDFVLQEFVKDEPFAQHVILNIEYDIDCNVKNIYKWNEINKSYEMIYFRGY